MNTSSRATSTNSVGEDTGGVFCSGSAEEALLLAEFEVQVCAILRHLARARLSDSAAQSGMPGASPVERMPGRSPRSAAAAVAAAVADVDQSPQLQRQSQMLIS